MARTAIMWFRRDLRLADNEALVHACARATDVLCAAVLPRESESGHGGAPVDSTRRSWRRGSLDSLDADLRARGGALVLREGDAAAELLALCGEIGADTVCCTRDWTPAGDAEERAVAEALATVGCELAVSEGSLLVAPTELATGDGGPYRVFTPFWKAWQRAWMPTEPLPAPMRVARPTAVPASSSPRNGRTDRSTAAIPDLGLWWTVGEAGAQVRLAEFAADALSVYADDRDHPGLRGTSELSPRLATGELSPRQVAWAATEADPSAAEPFLRQLAWREFAYHVLHHFPKTEREPLRPEYSAMPWHDDPELFAVWATGQTGYPLVDAGMRQLLATGWMHNRARLVCGSFLAKDLLIAWQSGEAYFRERLADYDTASNVFNWQWVSGCGADAAPYFRIFNPTVQGSRFDPDGEYVRRWVPELADVPVRWIHRPWSAPAGELAAAGVILGKTYPEPIVDHFEARDRALAAFSSIKRA